jgi:hypothetical protein
MTCGLKDRTADEICQRIKSAYEACGFPHNIGDYSRMREAASALAKSGFDPEELDPEVLDCVSPDAFFEGLEEIRRRYAQPETDVSSLVSLLDSALDDWRRGVDRSRETAQAIEEYIKQLAELGERRLAYQYYETARELRVPIRLRLRKPPERRAARRRAAREAHALLEVAEEAAERGRPEVAEELAREVEIAAQELAKIDAVAVELARKVVWRWFGEIDLSDIKGLTVEQTTDGLSIRLTLRISEGEEGREEERKLAERLAAFFAVYGVERRESATRKRVFIHYILPIDKSESWARLVETMKVLYKVALDEVKRAKPGASPEEVLADALKAVDNWLAVRDVHISLATSPSQETLKRLLTLFPLAKEEKPPAQPPIERAPTRWRIPPAEMPRGLEEFYRKSLVEAVRELAWQQAVETMRTGILMEREPDGKETCWGVLDERACFRTTRCRDECLALLIDILYRADKITKQEWEEARAALLNGAWGRGCEVVRRHMDFFASNYRVREPPPFCH